MTFEARVTSQSETEEVGAALARLEADGWIVRQTDSWRTSRRWQQAMARAAVALYQAGDNGDDLRTPIAHALLERYAAVLDDEQLVALVETMLPIELASLGLPGSG